jgi:hypothetical protein
MPYEGSNPSPCTLDYHGLPETKVSRGRCCKSALFALRRFESYSLHSSFQAIVIQCFESTEPYLVANASGDSAIGAVYHGSVILGRWRKGNRKRG